VLGLAGALVGVVPDGVSAVVARKDCRATAFVTRVGGVVSTIDVTTRTKNPTDIAVGSIPVGLAVTPDGKTLFVVNRRSDSVSTIDVKTGTKNPTDIAVGSTPRESVGRRGRPQSEAHPRPDRPSPPGSSKRSDGGLPPGGQLWVR
jgi:YVTN family beta-propeller protein